MSVSNIRQAIYFPRRAPAQARPAARVMTDGSPQTAPVRPRTTPGPREIKQQLLDSLLKGANANKVRDIATGRPDLMEAASPEQRGQMTKVLLDKIFFGSADRQAILSVMKPAVALGELPAAVAAVKGSGKLPMLFEKLSGVDEGMTFARLGLEGGIYADRAVVEDMGLNGVHALVRVATDEQLDALPVASKQLMIAILMSGPASDESEVMIRRLRKHLG